MPSSAQASESLPGPKETVVKTFSEGSVVALDHTMTAIIGTYVIPVTVIPHLLQCYLPHRVPKKFFPFFGVCKPPFRNVGLAFGGESPVSLSLSWLVTFLLLGFIGVFLMEIYFICLFGLTLQGFTRGLSSTTARYAGVNYSPRASLSIQRRFL